MPSDEKYQAGEHYGDAEKESTNYFADPTKIAKDILKDAVGLAGKVTIRDIVSLIEELVQVGQPLDDKKGYC